MKGYIALLGTISCSETQLESPTTQQIGCLRSVTVCFTCARNIVFQDKIKFCVDVGRMVSFPCIWRCFICVSFKTITQINVWFVCVYFGFTLLSNICWTQNVFKSAHCEYENFRNTLALICWVVVPAMTYPLQICKEPDFPVAAGGLIIDLWSTRAVEDTCHVSHIAIISAKSLVPERRFNTILTFLLHYVFVRDAF